MNDHLHMRGAPFKSWDGVKNALYKFEDLSISSHAMRFEGYKALNIASSG